MRKTLHAILTGALLVVFVGVSLPFLLPMDTYKPALESQLSDATGRYILIDSLQLSMLPAPELTATGITVWGKDTGGDELHIRSMRIDPDLPRLIFNKEFVIRRVKLSGVETSQAFVAAVREALSSDQRPSQSTPTFLSIEQISASSVEISTTAGKVLGPYDLDLIFEGDAAPTTVRLGRSDRRLDARFTRTEGRSYDMQLSASDWTLPIGPALHFDELSAIARVGEEMLEIDSLTTDAYGGKLDGKGRLSWSDAWRLEGAVQAQGVTMAPIVKLFGGRGFDGRFSGDLALQFKSDTSRGLFTHPMVSGNFEIADGVITTAGRDRPWFAFDRLAARGIVNRIGLVTKQTRLEAYGGTVEGDTATTWAEGWAIEASLTASSVDTGHLLKGFLARPVLDGRFEGEASVNLAANRFLALADNPTVAGHFRLTDGVIYEADLKEASTHLSKEGTTGGQTEFKTLSGRAVIQDHSVELDDLEMVSTALTAGGSLKIARDDTLSGQLDVGVRNTATLISIPILVRGTTDEPSLRPTSSAMIGGMVGTSVLGPGVGTAVGIKVGKFFQAIGSAISGGGDD